MIFRSDKQRKAIFANFFSKGSMNSFSISPDEFERLRKGAIEFGPKSKEWDKFQEVAEQGFKEKQDAEKSLSVEDFINRGKLFVSTPDNPSPPTALSNLGAVIAGTKPAMETLSQETSDPRFKEMMDIAIKSGLSVVEKSDRDIGGGVKVSHYIVGIEPNVSVINEHIDKFENSLTSGHPYVMTPDIDIKLGKAFGYSDAAVNDYLKTRYEI